MGLISTAIDFVLHVDKYIAQLVTIFGPWSYLIIFSVVFIETGLVFTPFLPGDSLIFASATLAGTGMFNIWILFAIFAVAAILGDTVNYWIGYYIGKRIFHARSKFFNIRHLEETERFFDKYGSEAIILARFMPIIRTFAPFFAGMGRMKYWKFLAYNAIGGVVWVALFCTIGYYFGQLEWVKTHFTLVLIGIIVISLIPAAVQILKRLRPRQD